jgi:hypothetical protein
MGSSHGNHHVHVSKISREYIVFVELTACIVQPQPLTRTSHPPYEQRLHRTYSSPFIAMLPKTAVAFDEMPPISQSRASRDAISRFAFCSCNGPTTKKTRCVCSKLYIYGYVWRSSRLGQQAGNYIQYGALLVNNLRRRVAG